MTLTATPQTGASPLSVSFSAAGTDPEGGALDYRYSSGDQSGSASGSEVTHEHGVGTYTARVTMTDPEGAKTSAEQQITVTRNGGS